MKTQLLSQRHHKDLHRVMGYKGMNIYMCREYLRKTTFQGKNAFAFENNSDGWQVYRFCETDGDIWGRFGPKDITTIHGEGPAYIFKNMIDLCSFTGKGLKIVLNEVGNSRDDVIIKKTAQLLIDRQPPEIFFFENNNDDYIWHANLGENIAHCLEYKPLEKKATNTVISPSLSLQFKPSIKLTP